MEKKNLAVGNNVHLATRALVRMTGRKISYPKEVQHLQTATIWSNFPTFFFFNTVTTLL